MQFSNAIPPRLTLKVLRETSEAKSYASSPKDAVQMIEAVIGDADREMFCVLPVDTKNAVLGLNVAHIGTLDQAVIGVRDVAKIALLTNAASVILAHNHPSGDPTPSPEDVAITKKIKDGLAIFDIDVLDHIIVGDPGTYCSMREGGMI